MKQFCGIANCPGHDRQNDSCASPLLDAAQSELPTIEEMRRHVSARTARVQAVLSSKLRACPFCGNQPTTNSYAIGGKSYAWVRCEACLLRKELNTEGEGHQSMVLDAVTRWWNGPQVETKAPRPDAIDRLQKAYNLTEPGRSWVDIGDARSLILEVMNSLRSAEKSEGDCSECDYYRSTGLGSCKKCGRDLVHCPKCKTALAFEGDVCGLCNPVAQP